MVDMFTGWCVVALLFDPARAAVLNLESFYCVFGDFFDFSKVEGRRRENKIDLLDLLSKKFPFPINNGI